MKRIIWISIICIIVIIEVLLNYSKQTLKSFYIPSYKEQKSFKKEFDEYFDSTSNQYSNFKYGFAIRFPQNWVIDQGVSEHTIIRALVRDSLISYSVNIIEVNNRIDDNFLKTFERERETYIKGLLSNIEKTMNTKIINYKTTNIYVANFEAVKYDFDYNVKQLQYEYTMKSTLYQILKDNLIFSISFHVPKILYNENPAKYDNLINDFNFIMKKN